MKYIFIINPAAGKRKLQKHLLTQIQLLLPPEEYQIFYTACPGDGQRLAAQAVQANRDICILPAVVTEPFLKSSTVLLDRCPLVFCPAAAVMTLSRTLSLQTVC